MTISRKWILEPYFLAHHPLCCHYKQHVFTLGEWKLCRGCTMFYSGIFVGLLVSILFFGPYQGFDPIGKGILLYLLVFPVFLLAKVPFIVWQFVRDISKFILGISIPISILTIITSPWWVTAIILAHFATGLWLIQRFRGKKTEEICKSCSEFSIRNEGRCSGYRLAREREFIFRSRERLGGPIDPAVQRTSLDWDETRLSELEND